MDEAVLAGQLAYYRARAGEYDEVYEQRGFTGISGLPIAGDVLELACGTGQWTARLAPLARSWTALDGAPEMLEIARRRVPDGVELRRADLFAWEPGTRYDVVFFAFWLSHVPADRFAAFWGKVGRALRPGGRAVFVDTDEHEARLERRDPGRPEIARRSLKNGSEHEIVKVYHDPAGLAGKLAELGWNARVDPAPGGFIRGVATLTTVR
ncbi:class I SAM-dependent methyltransferase [Dactylosporangium sp. CA-233914]|uniref:class I SAM-dependent methyltransferase n=1 Tax=Dactylosporangium sp. CA-233914 TaxID=3239934 RepID=UPI003D8B3EF8